MGRACLKNEGQSRDGRRWRKRAEGCRVIPGDGEREIGGLVHAALNVLDVRGARALWSGLAPQVLHVIREQHHLGMRLEAKTSMCGLSQHLQHTTPRADHGTVSRCEDTKTMHARCLTVTLG